MSAVAPYRLVTDALSGAPLLSGDRPLFLVAAGKSAWPMARAMCDLAGHRLQAGVVTGPVDRQPVPDGLAPFAGGHPAPDKQSEAAAMAAISVARRARGRGQLVALISGGASAMLAAPAEGVSLADKCLAVDALSRAGVAIADLNCVRRHLSRVKGGWLGVAAGGEVVTLAISDVHAPVEDDPTVIGSGPTVADPTTFADALRVAGGRATEGRIPRAVMDHLRRGAAGQFDETPKPGDERLAGGWFAVLANRYVAMTGAARAAEAIGYDVLAEQAPSDGEARFASVRFLAAAQRAAATWLQSGGGRRGLCVLASGETVVRVMGPGRGGRNQEFVLAAVRGLADASQSLGLQLALASAGTDGIDGPTDAAGAWADGATLARAAAARLDPDAALALNASHGFFDALDGLLRWGPTHTNVGDLHVCLVTRPQPAG